MPWEELCTMQLREKFVVRALDGGSPFAALCREFGISRKTGYKWLERYKARGVPGLEDMSRRPQESPLRTSPDLVAEVVRVRVAHPRWGPRKISEVLKWNFHEKTPSARTVARILTRSGLLQPMVRRRSRPFKGSPQRPSPEVKRPNDLWTVDFKGWWFAKNREKCEPLTVRDAKSRFVLAIRILDTNDGNGVRGAFEELFEQFGMPKAIQSDNGAPFVCSHSHHGLTQLSAWWASLGIEHYRSRPAKPSDNGGHERMHRDIAEEIEAYAAYSKAAQQQACDRWRHDFNHHRPHEALGMKTPASQYRRSEVSYAGKPGAILYPDNFHVRLVSNSGDVKFQSARVFISTAARGLNVGLEPLGKGQLRVWLARKQLGQVDCTQDTPVLMAIAA